MSSSSVATSKYEYRSAEPSESHDILLAPIKDFLSGLPLKACVLDLGCGNGSLTTALARPDWRVCGVDLSESGIREARGHFPNIEFASADVTEDLTAIYPPCSFDAIISAEVIEHVYAPRSLIRNCRNLLAPGGVLIITTPYNGYLKNIALAITGNMDRHWDPLWDGGHIKFWSRRTITQLLAEGGFQITDFRGVGRFRYLWKGMVLRAIKRDIE